jgi:hypothetical protein
LCFTRGALNLWLRFSSVRTSIPLESRPTVGRLSSCRSNTFTSSVGLVPFGGRRLPADARTYERRASQHRIFRQRASVGLRHTTI